MTNEEFIETLHRLFGDARWPKPLHLLQALRGLRSGIIRDGSIAARNVGTSRAALEKVLAASDPVSAVLGVSTNALTNEAAEKTAQMLGQLLLGQSAETAFEDIYKDEMRTHELELRDLRESRNDTDYRVYNGQGRPVYRLNIKFHGSPFRRAVELVELQPEDCFALATYKIHSAQDKQGGERLPYIFTIVGVPGLTGASVGAQMPRQLVEAMTLLNLAPKAEHKRDIEERIVRYIVENDLPIYRETYQRMRQADWYILSANKAVKLLREKLFDRVFALRMRNFARAFGRAELDMHFSLREDLTPLNTFLRTLRDEGPTKVAAMLTNGDY